MTTKVHRVRFYNPKPQTINCVSLNRTSKYLALARDDSSIEIWDLNYAPYLLKYIPGVENEVVEALGWVHERLLSTGLNGALIEWDLEKLRIKNSVLLTGYAAWCLDISVDNTMVAVGTEQGYVNLYNTENNEIVYKKLFDKQEGRILCCKFNKTGNVLVTGSINTIRVWNVETGHATTRMLVSRRGKEVIVWSLAVLSDDTVVSGDSNGRLTFWDSNIGNELESYVTHKADILSITVSDDEDNLFCSGVDPVITNFVRIKKQNDQNIEAQWVKNVQRNIHEHDVRDLVLNGKQLISVGVDGYLTFSSYPPKWVMRIPHMLPNPRSTLCASKKLLLLRFSNHIEVWKLGSYAVNESGNVILRNGIDKGDINPHENNIEEDSTMQKIKTDNTEKQRLKIVENPTKLVSVQPKGKKQIKYCTLSPSGEFIAYSTDSCLRILKLEADDDQNVSLSKVIVNGLSSGCDRFTFTEDSRWMAVNSFGSVNILHVDPEAGATVVQTISLEKHLSEKTMLHLVISKETTSGSTYLIAADTVGSIAVWRRNGKKFEHYVNLPKYHCVPSALVVDDERENLIITYVDQKIVEYELVNKKFTEWPGSGLPPEWLHRSAAVDSIAIHPKGHSVLFQDATSLWEIKRQYQEQHEPVSKRKFDQNGDRNYALKVIPIKYISDFRWIGNDEAVLLEMLPENIVAQLPPVAVMTKKRDRI